MTQYDQRTLLATGAAGAAGLALWAAYRRYHGQGPSEEPVRVGLIGTGWAVKVQLPQFRRAGLKVTAIASRKESNAISLAAEHHIDNPFGSTHGLCQSDVVDLVSVVTPTYLHSEQMIAALAAGKHVVVDKPMALNGEEGERMLAAASAHKSQVAIVDHELRFTRAFQRARELLRQGNIGHVVAVDTTVFLGAHPGVWTWWQDSGCGGGMLGAVGSHIIDACRFLLDCEFSSVAAYLETLEKDRPDPVTGDPRACTADDYASLQFQLAPRGGGTTSAAWDVKSPSIVPGRIVAAMAGAPPPAASHFVITGTKGSIFLDATASSMFAWDASGKVLESVKGGPNAFMVTGTHGMGVALQAALGPRGDRAALAPAATTTDGLAVVYVMDAARKSSLQGGLWQTPKIV